MEVYQCATVMTFVETVEVVVILKAKEIAGMERQLMSDMLARQ